MRDCKLFVGGLNPVTDDYRLKEFYSNFGVVSDAVVMKDGAGRSRGFGFVTYETPEMCDTACNNRPHEIDGKLVDAKKAVPKGEQVSEPDTPVTKIFIGGLRRNLRHDDLTEYFSKYGGITEAVVMVDRETNQSRGFGFVNFVDTDIVDRVIADCPHSIHGFPVDVKKALTKDDTKPQRRNNYPRTPNDSGFQSSAPAYSSWPQQMGWPRYTPQYQNAGPPSSQMPPAAPPAAQQYYSNGTISNTPQPVQNVAGGNAPVMQSQVPYNQATGNYGQENYWSNPTSYQMGYYQQQQPYSGGPMRNVRPHGVAPPYGR